MSAGRLRALPAGCLPSCRLGSRPGCGGTSRSGQEVGGARDARVLCLKCTFRKLLAQRARCLAPNRCQHQVASPCVVLMQSSSAASDLTVL